MLALICWRNVGTVYEFVRKTHARKSQKWTEMKRKQLLPFSDGLLSILRETIFQKKIKITFSKRLTHPSDPIYDLALSTNIFTETFDISVLCVCVSIISHVEFTYNNRHLPCLVEMFVDCIFACVCNGCVNM